VVAPPLNRGVRKQNKMLDEDALGPFARKFAVALFREFPAWREHARNDEPAGATRVVEIPSPRDPAGNSLWIATDNDEISVGSGMFHSHFEWPDDSDWPEGALGFIRDLVADRVLIADTVANRHWCGSTVITPGETPEKGSDQIVYVRSWSGQLDREV
jgi:hypothetical protein